MSVTLIDYGLGNIQAFINIYHRLNIPVHVARTPEQLKTAERIILPGVGAFDWAMDSLDKSGMRDCLDDLVRGKGRPVIGVCVGMQIMARCSEEGVCLGLGWFDADVKQLPTDVIDRSAQLPHMGWNSVFAPKEGLFADVEDPRYYFLHSYYFAPRDPADLLATTNYHGIFAAAVGKGNIFGVQFHPEKSHHWGVQLLKNFAKI